MSAAIRAKSAKARAGIAARMLKNNKTWTEGGWGMGRAFDNCFEMGDGDAVYLDLMRRADADEKLLAAIKRHGCGHWLDPDYRKRAIAREEERKPCA